MRYQSILLELLIANPELYERLKANRDVLATVKRWAREFEARHQEEQAALRERFPSEDYRVIANRALELALPEFAERISSGDSAGDAAPFERDAALAALAKATPPR